MDVRGWSVIAVLAIAGCSGRQAASVDEAAEAASAAPVPSQPNATADAGSTHGQTASMRVTAKQGPADAEGHFLEGERMLLNEGAVSAQRSEAVLGSDKAFAQAISQFERDAAGHPEVQDLTRLYRTAATRLIGNDGTLVSFACGYSLCVGEIRSRTDEDFSAWSEAIGMDKAAPVYSLTTAPMTRGRDQRGGRFVFSVDPAANGIAGP
ncbi:hypothetical protein [Stenotrophomonas maltophilia]|uniref:hypothetical protein n=1 Tax=Stenotrophomonas maltophilia TaxID=40324 RepID=UPI0002B8B746|nr:hypothetical protein [Stenotrophomonas maltophilia]EMF61131.1 Hypothetical protein EPM1_1937 [Stenotrophomonas maltophilia EPM1]KWV47641.1 hypothetical protein AS591_15600 [Stenotrophomonas maltophilia]MBA0460563.1 hypothetical protein [Stenotrophomonas maltophilia]MBC8773136.1 hypothetical protein [Stenotrophomonas maltophilia]QJC74362.1 hypothetical protein HGN30_10490 [Stenotrophomonas maltophilia]